MSDHTTEEVQTERQASDFLKLSPRSLQRMRQSGDGPAFCVLGSRIVYRRQDLESWLQSKRVSSTSEHSERVRQAA